MGSFEYIFHPARRVFTKSNRPADYRVLVIELRTYDREQRRRVVRLMVLLIYVLTVLNDANCALVVFRRVERFSDSRNRNELPFVKGC